VAGDPNGDLRPGSPGPSSEGGTKRPLGAVLASAVDGIRTLLRKQVELAKLEVSAAVGTRAAGAGMMAAAGALALLAFGFVAAAGAAALALVMPTWAAILIVAIVLLATAGVLVLVARRAIRTAPAMAERSKETMKEDARWAKRQIAR
jgi:putative superfamily III holin-X